MIQHGIGIVLLTIYLILLNGCCGPYYIQHAIADTLSYNKTIEAAFSNISLQLHRLTKRETHVLFDYRGKYLYQGNNPLYALHIHIINNRDHTIYLGRNDVTIPLIDETTIAQRLHVNTCGRVITVTTASIAAATMMFFGAAYITICGVMIGIPALIKTGYAALAVSGVFFFGAPFWATQQARRSWRTNDLITSDIKEKSIKEIISIPAGYKYHVLIFVSQADYAEEITFTFHEENTNEEIPISLILEDEL